jgi:nucleoside-diphosphate-sugar epimerase
MKNITILGLGWLGLPLAKSLIKKGINVIGTSTSNDKIESINASENLNAIKWALEMDVPKNLIEKSLKADICIIAIPASHVFKNLETVIYFLQKLPDSTEIILISSTGVYPEKLALASENYQFDEIELTNSNVQIEQKIASSISQRLTILRLAGLIGPNRHPIKQLQGRIDIPNGDSPVNLVHLNDVISFIELLIQEQKFGDIVNVCHPSHPTREEYYKSAADFFQFSKPTFLKGSSRNKQIDSEKSQNSYCFEYKSDILDFSQCF